MGRYGVSPLERGGGKRSDAVVEAGGRLCPLNYKLVKKNIVISGYSNWSCAAQRGRHFRQTTMLSDFRKAFPEKLRAYFILNSSQMRRTLNLGTRLSE